MRPLLVPALLLVALVAGAACGQVKPMPTPVEPIRTDNLTAPSFEHRVPPPAEEPAEGADTRSESRTTAPDAGAEAGSPDGGTRMGPADGGTQADGGSLSAARGGRARAGAGR